MAYLLLTTGAILLLLASVLLLRRLFQPYKRLALTAGSRRQTAGSRAELQAAGGFIKPKDEASFILGTFQEIIAKLREKERELERLHRLQREKAEESERFSEKIVSSIESALITVDKSGRINTFNPAAEQIFRLKFAEVNGFPYQKVFAQSPEMVELIDDCLCNDSSHKRKEIRIVDRDGVSHFVGMTISPIKGTEGASTGALCLLTDLTEIIELQEHMKLKENLAALGEMSAGIAHEFKNALATISGYGQLILGQSQDPAIKEHAEALLGEVRYLVQIVANFLDFAKPTQLNVEEVDLSELLLSCVREIESEDRFSHVTVSCEGEFPKIKGDRVLLRQAVANILRNAAEAISPEMPERKIRIRCRIEDQASGANVHIDIEDTGAGVPESMLERIFLPFYTTKPQGTGLGLAIAQKIAVHHNGKISVRRRNGGGSIFSIVLPADPASN